MTSLTLNREVRYDVGGDITLTGILTFDHPAKEIGTTTRHEEIRFPQPSVPRSEWGDTDLIVAVQARYPRATVAWAVIPAEPDTLP